MGADIHAYIDEASGVRGASSWAKVRIDRDYWLFGLLAGVRGGGAVFPPRGTPEEMGWFAEDDYWITVTDKADVAIHDGWCLRETAEEYIAHGSKPKYHKDGGLWKVAGPDWHSSSWLYADEVAKVQEKYAKVALANARKEIATLAAESDDEMGRIAVGTLRPHYQAVIDRGGANRDLAAIIAAMRALNGDDPRWTRLVFWFDN